MDHGTLPGSSLRFTLKAFIGFERLEACQEGPTNWASSLFESVQWPECLMVQDNNIMVV